MAQGLCCKTGQQWNRQSWPCTAVGPPANEVQCLPTKLGEGQAVQLATGAAQGCRPLFVCDRLVQQANALRQWENALWQAGAI